MKVTSMSWVVEMADTLLPMRRGGTMPLLGIWQVGML